VLADIFKSKLIEDASPISRKCLLWWENNGREMIVLRKKIVVIKSASKK